MAEIYQTLKWKAENKRYISMRRLALAQDYLKIQEKAITKETDRLATINSDIEVHERQIRRYNRRIDRVTENRSAVEKDLSEARSKYKFRSSDERKEELKQVKYGIKLERNKLTEKLNQLGLKVNEELNKLHVLVERRGNMVTALELYQTQHDECLKAINLAIPEITITDGRIWILRQTDVDTLDRLRKFHDGAVTGVFCSTLDNLAKTVIRAYASTLFLHINDPPGQ